MRTLRLHFPSPPPLLPLFASCLIVANVVHDGCARRWFFASFMLVITMISHSELAKQKEKSIIILLLANHRASKRVIKLSKFRWSTRSTSGPAKRSKIIYEDANGTLGVLSRAKFGAGGNSFRERKRYSEHGRQRRNVL